MIRRKGNVYKLDTPATTLLIRAETEAEYLYYGERLAVPGCDYEIFKGRDKGTGPALRLFSALGGDAPPFGIACVFADGSFLPRFAFRRAGLAEKPPLSPLPSSYSDSPEKNACQTLCLEFADEPSRLRLFLYYTVFDDSDVVAVSARLVNGGRKEVAVRGLASLQLEICGGDYALVTFEKGFFEGRSERPVPVGGSLTRETAAGFGAPFCRTLALLERPGRVYAAGLLYAGAVSLTAAADEYPRARLQAGINDALFGKRLAPGESVSSPEALMTFAVDEDGARAALRSFFRAHVARGKWKDKDRPVVYRGRPGAGREEAAAEIGLAAEAGAEVYAAEAEAFGETEGMAELAALVRERGLKFGVCVRPQTAETDGALCRRHPEFTLKPPGREPLLCEGRALLNFADARVQKYAVRALSALLSATKAAYMKWECGVPLSGGAAKESPAGEYFPRYAEGLYIVAEKLAERFPGVLLEGVTDRGERDASAFACGGAAEIKKKLSFFKKYRRLLERGREYALRDCAGAACGSVFAAENKACAVAFVSGGARGLILRGLDAGTVYAVSARDGDSLAERRSFSAAGELLMKGGIPPGEGGEGPTIFVLERAKKGKNV